MRNDQFLCDNCMHLLKSWRVSFYVANKNCHIKIVSYLICGCIFIRHGPSIFHVREDVSRKPKALQAFLEDIKSKNGMEQHEALKRHYQAAMSELHYVPEVQLLERVSAALGDLTSLKILQPFHALCLSLLKASDVEIPDELKAAHDMKYQTADQHDPEKRSCSQPTENTCRGMCGKGCSCWSWFCGDCCWHRGCYEHDICCNYGRFTSYYAFPFRYGFTCEKFGGYPECKSGSLGWRRK